MKTLSATELMERLKESRKKQVEIKDGEAPDYTYATPEQRVEPSVMPTGQGEL